MPPGDLVVWVTVIAVVWLAASVVLAALLIAVIDERESRNDGAPSITGGPVDEFEETPTRAR